MAPPPDHHRLTATHLGTRAFPPSTSCSLPALPPSLPPSSPQDVAEKLCLPSADDAEYICAKAIRDGGIDALVDHAGGFLATRELTDLYSTNEPQVRPQG